MNVDDVIIAFKDAVCCFEGRRVVDEVLPYNWLLGKIIASSLLTFVLKLADLWGIQDLGIHLVLLLTP